MSRSTWFHIYEADIAAPRESVFELIADLPRYPEWLPSSPQYAATTEVDPIPSGSGAGTRRKPGQAGELDWWGTVTGFVPPGSIDFHHTIRVPQLLATVEADIHYSFEATGSGTRLRRWLDLGFDMPFVLRPLRSLIIRPFDRENVRTIAALTRRAESA